MPEQNNDENAAVQNAPVSTNIVNYKKTSKNFFSLKERKKNPNYNYSQTRHITFMPYILFLE